jgi:hypothetical protein
MRHLILALAALTCFPLGFAQATPQGLDVDVYVENSLLKQIDYENFLGPIENREVERERRGARLAWGSDANQGFAQVFSETADLTTQTRTEMTGVGFGSQGILTFSTEDAGQGLVVPWRVDLTYAHGGITEGPSHGSAYYLEAYADIGIGLQSHNIQASVGVASSAFYGYMRYDSVLLSNESIDGTNGGTYFDVQYKRPGSPLYTQLRYTYGDYESTMFRLGLKF